MAPVAAAPHGAHRAGHGGGNRGEGEDLHTFCSNVYHYGIAWMPSELEQRVGRVDRVGSQTERRLGGPRSGGDEELLQVYYPHLNDTVEVLQLRRVYERLNRFMRMMHEGLGAPQKEQAEVRVGHESLRFQVDTEAIRTPLVSAFRVTPPMVEGTRRPLAATADAAARMRSRLDAIEVLVADMGATSITRKEGHQILGEMQLGSRFQPFTLILRSLRGSPLLRCVSPIGRVTDAEWRDDLAVALVGTPFVRLALERNEKYEAYDVAIEGDILLGAAPHDLDRARNLIKAVTDAADRIEEQVLGRDERLTILAPGLNAELDVAR